MKHEIGEIVFQDEPVTVNEGREAICIMVSNTGDRTVQVCSHYHFFECNKALRFDREAAYGMHLDIPSGTAVRFEPGTDKKVSLTPFRGERKLYGFAGWVMGQADDPAVKERALQKCREELFDGL